MPVRAILFDKDGTLVDFHATYDAATYQVLEQICLNDEKLMQEAADVLKYDLEAGQISSGSVIIAGCGLDIARSLQTTLGFDDAEAYSRFLDRLYGEISNSTVKWLPGAREALQELGRSGFTLGIATNDSEANAISQLSTLDADHFFQTILGADSGYGSKPGPGMVKAFSERHGVPCSEIVMVGDSVHDLQAGKAAGARTCGVMTGPADRNELEAVADHTLVSIVGLPDLLQQLV